MNKHHIERLQKLNAFLGTVDPKKFNHTYTASVPYRGFKITPDISMPGATADALGYAGMMPEFRRAGLVTVWRDKVHQCSLHG